MTPDTAAARLPFSPLTMDALNERVADANTTIAHVFRSACRSGRQLDDWDLARMAEAAELADAYHDAAWQRVEAMFSGVAA